MIKKLQKNIVGIALMADNIYSLDYFPRLRGNETALNLICWDFKSVLLYIYPGKPHLGLFSPGQNF